MDKTIARHPSAYLTPPVEDVLCSIDAVLYTSVEMGALPMERLEEIVLSECQ